MSKSRIALALLLVVAAFAGTLASSNAQQLGGPAQCGTFYDRGQAPGAPATMMTMFSAGREIIAAQDCVAKGDTSKACEHYRRIEIAFGRMGPRFAPEQFTSVRAQMQQASCQ
jgi:hypothetical protein